MVFLKGSAAILAILGVTGIGAATEARAKNTGKDGSPVTVSAPTGLTEHLHQRAGLSNLRQGSPGTPKTETVLLDEDFEGSWPTSPWRVYHGSDAADVDWGRTSHRASEQSFSIWCAASGSDAPEDGGVAPPGTSSWTVAGPFDLSEATTGSLTFDLWLKTELFHDNFMWLVSTDGENFTGRARSSNTEGWATITVDLADWVDGLDVTGEPLVWIAFVYQSDHDIQFEGAYIDQVRLVADSGEQGTTGRTYSSDEDFASGSLVGLEAESDTLKMSDSWSAMPYLWIPSSLTGTASKVDTETGDELARYRTGPAGITLAPTPAVVDLDGACWVGNRTAGTLVKIGLSERGGCVDRNGNGIIDTSTDADGDGDISSDEIPAWGEDECVLLEVVLVPGHESVFTPGDHHEEYSDINLRTMALDAENRIWAGIESNKSLSLIDGGSGEYLKTINLGATDTSPFAVIVDAGGDLWCSTWPNPWVLKIDPDTEELEEFGLIHGSRGLALDGNQHLFISGFRHSAVSRVDLDAGAVDFGFSADYEADSMVVTEDRQLCVAAEASQSVRRYSMDGFVTGTLNFGNFPSAVALDNSGKIWVTGRGSGILVRINAQTMGVEVEKTLLGISGLNPTGDLTGLVARSITAPFGSWAVVFDSQQANTAWGTLSWIATEPEGTALRVRTRSSHDQDLWSGWETAVNGADLQSTPAGRYLEIEVAMKRPTSGESPELDEITVTPVIEDGAPDALFSWSPADPLVGQTVTFTDNSTGEPTSWTWDFGDGETSSDQHPTHVFTSDGTYSVSLTAGNDAGEDTVTQDIVVTARGSLRTPDAPLR
ncbi:MAG: PKD domain-containing protein [Acidobacteriota bacterium]